MTCSFTSRKWMSQLKPKSLTSHPLAQPLIEIMRILDFHIGPSVQRSK